MKGIKEYSILCIINNGKPYILQSFSNIYTARFKLQEIIFDLEKNNRIYYIDNDFFDNKYNINLKGHYYCIQERTVTNWKKSSNKEENKKSDNLIYFKNFA